MDRMDIARSSSLVVPDGSHAPDVRSRNSVCSEEVPTPWPPESRGGPDYDRHYSQKLEAYFQEEFGGLGDFEPIVA